MRYKFIHHIFYISLYTINFRIIYLKCISLFRQFFFKVNRAAIIFHYILPLCILKQIMYMAKRQVLEHIICNISSSSNISYLLDVYVFFNNCWNKRHVRKHVTSLTYIIKKKRFIIQISFKKIHINKRWNLKKSRSWQI